MIVKTELQLFAVHSTNMMHVCKYMCMVVTRSKGDFGEQNFLKRMAHTFTGCMHKGERRVHATHP